MARYIDTEAFKRKLIDEKSFFPAIIARALDEIPTANVVPKSEVEKIFEEIEVLFHRYDVDPNYTLDSMTNDISELKNKYMVAEQ